MFLLGFVPVLVCAGWMIVYAQPHANWFRAHVTSWSSDMGILHVVRDIATFNGVLAFGIGLVFAYVLEPGMFRRREVVAAEPATQPVVVDRTVADEPTLAEREAAAAQTRTRTVERTETTVR
jgi:hypothetical protein